MTYDVEIVLRHQNEAIVRSAGHPRQAREWTIADVREVLVGMLLALHRAGNPGSEDPQIALRGFSWIVEPFAGGGVVIALEIPMGAAIAGPFDAEASALTTLIARALASPGDAPTVH